jgi:hypothetical protein
MLYKKRAEMRNPSTQEVYKRTPKGGLEKRQKIRKSNHPKDKPSCRPSEKDSKTRM